MMTVKNYFGDAMMKVMLKLIMINNTRTEMISWRAPLGDGLPVDAGCINRSAAHHVPPFGISEPLQDKQVSLVTRENLCALLL